MPEQTALEEYSQTVSDEQFLKDEKLVLGQKPIGLVTQEYLHIKTKAAELIPLILNDTQKSIIKIIFKLLKEKKPIRLWILKSRQEGVSTLVEGIIYALTSQHENVNSLIMADEKEHANNLFDMSKLYQEMLEKKYSHLAPKLKKSNEKKLEFEGIHSQIIIATAENLEAAKSHTYQLVHLCMAETTRVLVNDNREVCIKDVKSGDKIVTHLGHSAKVKGISINAIKDITNEGYLVKISVSGSHSFPIECTSNHKLFIRDKKCNETIIKKELLCGSTKTGCRKNGRGKWVEAKEIKKGDMLGIPLRIVHHKFKDKHYIVGGKKIKADYDLGFVFGLYLAEGSMIYNRGKNGRLPSAMQLSMGEGEEGVLDRVSAIVKTYIKSYSFKRRKDSKTIVGIYYSSVFARFIKNELGAGGTKHIPNKYFSYPKDFILGLLRGYIDGDGHIDKKTNTISISSVRPQLIFQVRDLLLGMRIGYSSLIYRRPGEFYGRNCQEIWILGIYGHTAYKLRGILGYKVFKPENTIKRDWRLGRKHCWVKVDKIEKIEVDGMDEVYDLVLDHPDHSYRLVNGVAVHNSECAYFRDLKTVMSDLNQTVPDLPNTMIIGETTANGMELFYDEWIRAVQGKTEWLPVFIPWFAMKEYSMPLQNNNLYPLDGILFDTDNSQQSFLKEEQRLVKEYELTQEQLNWRRYTITNKCGGDITIFNREYPSSWNVAFQTSGKTFFNQPSLQRQIKQIPKRIGDIFREENKYIFRDLPNGRIKLYENPQPNEQYIVTLDASEAIGEDEASILVLNNRLNRTVAVVNGQYEPELLADIGSKLGYYYNEALIAPENKGYGYSVCQSLNQTYGNIYRRKITKNGKTERTDELGFNTNLNTRPEMLSRAAETILYNSCELVDASLINQCQTFIINPKTKKAEAALGKEDGLVICFAIAQQVRHEHPYKPPQNQSMLEIAAKRRKQSEVAVGSRF